MEKQLKEKELNRKELNEIFNSFMEKFGTIKVQEMLLFELEKQETIKNTVETYIKEVNKYINNPLTINIDNYVILYGNIDFLKSVDKLYNKLKQYSKYEFKILELKNSKNLNKKEYNIFIMGLYSFFRNIKDNI